MHDIVHPLVRSAIMPSATTPLAWLLVGPGDIACRRVAPALRDTPGSRLAAICGRAGSSKAAALAARTGGPAVFDDYDRALAESGADAVYIATQPRLHAAMVCKALAAGKHVFCEKPLGCDAGESLAMLRAERASACLAGCSNYRLFTPQFCATRRLIDEGRIGRLLGGEAVDEEPFYNPSKQTLRLRDGLSPVLSLGFYLINIAQHLFGMPEDVFAMLSAFNPEQEPGRDVDDLDNLRLRFPGGRQFAIRLNLTSRASIRHAYEFCGTGGRILWPGAPPHFDLPIELVTDAARPVEGSTTGAAASGPPNWHLPMIADFVAAVRERRPPLCTLESAAETALVTDALFRSAASGRVERVIPLAEALSRLDAPGGAA